MIKSKSTELGKVTISREVISTYAGNVALECFGIVGMATINMKDGLVKLLRRENIAKGINVELVGDHKLSLDFHVIVAYGVNIMSVAENLEENVRYKLEEFTGLKVAKVNIFVEGVRVID